MRPILFTLTLGLVGCSGSPSDSSSTEDETAMCAMAPCGGDVVGTWTLAASCLTTYKGTCGDTYDETNVTTTATLTLDASGGYSLRLGLSGTETWDSPLDGPCGHFTACPQCTGTRVPSSDPNQCLCKYPVDQAPSTASGMYTASDAGSISLTFQDSGKTWNASYDFCARGDMLVLNDWGGSALNGVYRRQ
jgi:hypothetical protein